MAGMKLFKNDCAGCHGDPNTAIDTRRRQSLSQSSSFRPASSKKTGLSIVLDRSGWGALFGMFAWAGQFGKDASGKDISMKEFGLR
jgi:hypothetical protein